MKKDFLVMERSFGHVEVDIPDNATEEEIIDAVNEAYKKGDNSL